MIRDIKDREYRVLEIIDRLRICRAGDIAWLCGYTDVSYCRKKLVELKDMKLLQVDRDSVGSNCYFLTKSGLNAIGKYSSRPYEISNTTNHALSVARLCTWIHITQDACILDMATDLILRKHIPGNTHRPDIVHRGTAYEVELSRKKMSDLECNILVNSHYHDQIWIVPDNKTTIAHNLETAAQSVGCDITILRLSEIEHTIAAANIHRNTWHKPAMDNSDMQANYTSNIVGKYGSYFNCLEAQK